MRLAENLRHVSGIYCTIHRDSGRCYVGSSVDMGKRRNEHNSRTTSEVTAPFKKALSEFGSDAFDFEVLERCQRSELLARERFYIVLMDSVRNGFNLVETPCAHYDFNFSVSTREKMRLAKLGKKLPPFSPERRANMSAAQRGQKRSAEALANMSKAQRNRAPETRIKQQMALAGRKYEEGRIAGMKGKNHTPEARRQISRGLTGRPCSPETRAKISASRRLSEATKH